MIETTAIAQKGGARRAERGAAEPGEIRAGARNRRRILQAATAQFARTGYSGTTIDSIAAGAGVPRANVYYYFASKAEIYRAIVDDLIAGWDDALGHIRQDAAPADALTAYVRAKLEHARRNGAESRLFALEILGGAPFLRKADREHMRQATRGAAAIVDHWVKEGRLKSVDPRHLFILLWSATQFYADFSILAADALEVSRLTQRDFEDAAQAIVAIVLRGLVPDHEPGA